MLNMDLSKHQLQNPEISLTSKRETNKHYLLKVLKYRKGKKNRSSLMKKHAMKNDNTSTLIPKQAIPPTVQWGMSKTATIYSLK